MSTHAAVWIDHKQARIFHLEPGAEITVTAASQHVHHEHSTGSDTAKHHPEDAKRFFRAVVDALDGSEKVLIVGPSTAKLDLHRFIHRHDQALERRVVGIETVDHPTDGQLVAFAKEYFS